MTQTIPARATYLQGITKQAAIAHTNQSVVLSTQDSYLPFEEKQKDKKLLKLNNDKPIQIYPNAKDLGATATTNMNSTHDRFDNSNSKPKKKVIQSSSSMKAIIAEVRLSEPSSPKQPANKRKTLKQNYLTNTATEKATSGVTMSIPSSSLAMSKEVSPYQKRRKDKK